MMAKKETKTDSASTEQPTPTPETKTETEALTEGKQESTTDPAEAALDAAQEEKKGELQEFFSDEGDTDLDLDEPIEEVSVQEAAQEAAEPQKVEAPEEPKPEGEKEPPAPTPDVEKAEPAAAPPAVEPPAETPTAPVPDRPPELTAEEVQQQYQTWRGEQEVQLAQHHYAIDEEMAQRLNEEPGVAIPQLMARVHVDSLVSTLGYVANQLPAMIDRAIALRETRTSDEGKFYERWPDLKATEHGEAISLLGNAYRKSNPGATPEQFIRDVGAQTMVAFGLSLGATPLAEAPEAPTPKPFRPANASPPSSGPAPQLSGIEKADKDMFETHDDLDLD